MAELLEIKRFEQHGQGVFLPPVNECEEREEKRKITKIDKNKRIRRIDKNIRKTNSEPDKEGKNKNSFLLSFLF